MITVKINDREVQQAVARLAGRCENLRPAMEDIGEYMIVATRERFVSGMAPDGSSWKPNTPATLQSQAYRRAGGTVLRPGEKGKIKGGSLAGKKPGIGESKRLSTEINYRPASRKVDIFSSLEYAATFHKGAAKGAFGRTRRGAPIPWGMIPARPFMGFSEQDKREVLGIIGEHLSGA